MTALLPISALTSPRDRFRCVPMAAELSVLACHARRAATYGSPQLRRASMHPECVRCELGAQVAERVPPTRAACPTCAAPGCARTVAGARGRIPLCPDHRRSAREMTNV